MVIIILTIWNLVLTYLVYKTMRALRYDYRITRITSYDFEKDGIWQRIGMYSERKLKWFWYN